MKKKQKKSKPSKSGKAVPLDSENWVSESSLKGSPVVATPASLLTPSSESETPAPQCDCCCDCYDGQGGYIPRTVYDEGSDQEIPYVNPSTGSPMVDVGGLSQVGGGGLNMGLGAGLQYSGDGSGAGGPQYGLGWVNPHVPTLIFSVPPPSESPTFMVPGLARRIGAAPTALAMTATAGSGNVFLVSGATETVVFQSTGTGYQAKYFVRDVLTYDFSTGRFIVTSPDGRQKIFYGLGGRLETEKDAYGHETNYTYLGERVTSVITGTGGDTVGYWYSYDLSGRLGTVVMRVGGTTESYDYRRVTYSYNLSGWLEKVVTEELVGGTWKEIETTYQRYHLTGLVGKLRFFLNDHAYKQMQSVNPDWPESATDEEIAQYANVEYVSYDYQGRVTEAKTNGGKYTTGIEYAISSHYPADPNVWTSKTIVTMPDGSTQTFYYNVSLNLLLKKVSEPQPGGGEKVWYPLFQQFDENTRIVLSGPSSAVDEVDESSPYLFTLKTNEGPMQVVSYDENGYKTMEGLQKGSAGSVVKLREFTYEPRTVNGLTIYVQSSVTEYREATESSSSDPVTTSFDYTWHTRGAEETFQIKTVTTTLPAVPESENGDDEEGTITATHDECGFVIEEVDAVGTKTTRSYYWVNGALQQVVQDAGPGRLNLTTDYMTDPLGRTVLSKGPVHTISLDGVATSIRQAVWTQYLDTEDEVRTIQGYVKTADGSEVGVNPVQIQRSFIVDPQVTGGRMEEVIAAVFDGSGVPPASHTYPQSDYVRWSTQHFSRENQRTHSRLYHLIPASGLGAEGTNYAQTEFGYDDAGRQNQATSPEGTIQKSVFNAMGWQMESLVGTSGANLVTTSTRTYDDGEDMGDGNLTKVTLKVDGVSGNDRIQNLSYDWRNRQTVSSATDGSVMILGTRIYDNLGNVTRADEYQIAVADDNLINRAEISYDARNRLYRTKRYGVDITDDGALQSALTSEVYYDQAGRTVRQTPAGKVGFSATHHDALGRPTKQFSAYGGTLDLDDPGNVSSATVIEQSEFAYDDAGNSISATVRQRFDDATGTGELHDPSSQPKARVSYSASYPDGLGRTQAVADYGTSGGDAWTRPATVPARSDTVLVTSFGYDDAGDQTETVDPMGTVARQEFDQAGRRVAVIENFHPGTGVGPDVNKTTRFAYNLDGNLTALTAVNPTTGDQVTEWIYGVTVAQGSRLESNALVYQKAYPGSTGTADRVTFRCNRQGQPIGMTDQAGTVHAYSYDRFGRITKDEVTDFGDGIDETVKKLTRSYEVRGMLETVGSLGTGTTPLNQVRLTYNAYSQLAQDAQSHSGAVNSGTPKVGYSYADGSANTVRPTGIAYPDGTATINLAYGGTAADALSRPDAIKEGSTTLCSYRYLGGGVVIGVKYDAASNVELTYRDGGTGDAGDPYTGLDRFGRLIETRWKKGAADKMRSKYGRNRLGGVTWRRDDETHAQGVNTEDNYYWYDGLQQVSGRQRGDLTGTAPNYTGITNLQQQEGWTYDATGNWAAYSDTSPTNAQTRTHNKVNEITQITAAVGNVNPSYDPSGNMLSLPKQPGQSIAQYALKWDAWNRLVSVTDGSTTVASYVYDGLTRRLTKTNAAETRHYYYNTAWRSIEERVEGASADVDLQYTWGLRDRWDLIRRVRSLHGTLDETLYVLKDYLDPVALADMSGNVIERYAYDAFGGARILTPNSAARTTSSYDWDYLFHCEFRDADTGLYNYAFRYYSPMLGRWQNRDPIEEAGGSNLYALYGNDPMEAVDWLGLLKTPRKREDCTTRSSSVSIGQLKGAPLRLKLKFLSYNFKYGGKWNYKIEDCLECCDDDSKKPITIITGSLSASAEASISGGYVLEEGIGKIRASAYLGFRGTLAGELAGEHVNATFGGCDNVEGPAKLCVAGSITGTLSIGGKFTAQLWYIILDIAEATANADATAKLKYCFKLHRNGDITPDGWSWQPPERIRLFGKLTLFGQSGQFDWGYIPLR